MKRKDNKRMTTRVIKGNFIFTKHRDNFEIYENSYIVIKDGIIMSLTKTLDEKYSKIPIEDYGDNIIIPGFIDLHLHAPQWPNRGIGYDVKLLPWLNNYTFPLESTYENLDIANENYDNFIKDIKSVGTTRSCVFATRHLPATKLLISKLKKSGLGAYVGKVNMDRNAEAPLVENTNDSINETLELIHDQINNNNKNLNPLVKYIITPRFVPSVTAELMLALGDIAEKYNLPIQSHLNENHDEIAWVKELHPDIPSFAHVYHEYGLLRPKQTIMAHCIHMKDEEIDLLKDKNIYIAHCVASNSNISSGMMPLRKYLDLDMLIGLGSDISGGHTLDMRENIVLTIQVSKILYTTNPHYKPVTLAEAFYLATKGGGSFFGKVGSFQEGYEFDALIIDDKETPSHKAPLINRLEKFIYTGNKDQIVKTFVRGKEIE